MQAKFKDMPKSMGYVGENLAIKYLIDKGYEILDKNFTVRGGEIDIVARKNGVFIFVEVKARTSDSFGEGNESVDRQKKNAFYMRLKNIYIQKLRLPDPDFRLDIIEIELDPETGAQKTLIILRI